MHNKKREAGEEDARAGSRLNTAQAPAKRSEPGEPLEKVRTADGRRFNTAFRLGPRSTRRPPSRGGGAPIARPSPSGSQLDSRRGTAPPPHTCPPHRARRAQRPAGRPAPAPRCLAGQGRADRGPGRPQHVCRSPPARSMRPARCITPPCPCRSAPCGARRGGEATHIVPLDEFDAFLQGVGDADGLELESVHPWLRPGHLHRIDALSPGAEKPREAAASVRTPGRRKRPRESGRQPRSARLQRASKRLPRRRGRRGFTGAQGETWRGSGRGEPCSGTSSIYSRLATHAHARPLSHTHTHTHAGARSERRCPLRSPPACPSSSPRQARPPRFPRAEVSAPRRRHCGATCRQRLARHPPRGREGSAAGPGGPGFGFFLGGGGRPPAELPAPSCAEGARPGASLPGLSLPPGLRPGLRPRWRGLVPGHQRPAVAFLEVRSRSASSAPQRRVGQRADA